MSKLSAQPVFVHTSISDTDEQWINIDNGDGTFTSQRMTMAQHRDLINSSPFFADDYLTDAGNNKNLLVYRSGSIMASNFNTRKSLTSSGASDDNKWWKVFEYLVTTDFDSDCFKVQMNELNESTGLGKSVIFDILLKRQDPYIYVNVNVESGLSAFDLSNFDVLYNSTTKKISIYYRVIPTFTFTNWLVLNGKVVNVSQMIWSNTLIGTSLSGETSDAFTTKTISLNKVNGVYTLPSTAPTSGKVLGYVSAGVSGWVTPSAGGLTYFTEAQNTATPNATVNVDSLTAIASTTNADISIVPKGTGAFTLAVADNLTSGGNKRGANSVDLQTKRSANTQVASGSYSFSAGRLNTASGDDSTALGVQNTASGSLGALAVGYGSVASGTGAIATGSSTSSGVTSLASGANCTASGESSVSLGASNTASGKMSFASGNNSVASGEYSTVMGYYASAFGLKGRWVTGQLNTSLGDSQKSIFTLNIRTTGATPTILTSGFGSGSPSAINQLVLQNNNSIRFKGTIIARQSGSTNTSAWDIDGIIQRGTSAGTTTLLISNVNVVQNTPAWGTPTLTADTTNGGLKVEVTGASTTNIQWTCIIDTTEVIYA